MFKSVCGFSCVYHSRHSFVQHKTYSALTVIAI
jgi:hypothetical protein